MRLFLLLLFLPLTLLAQPTGSLLNIQYWPPDRSAGDMPYYNPTTETFDYTPSQAFGRSVLNATNAAGVISLLGTDSIYAKLTGGNTFYDSQTFTGPLALPSSTWISSAAQERLYFALGENYYRSDMHTWRNAGDADLARLYSNGVWDIVNTMRYGATLGNKIELYSGSGTARWGFGIDSWVLAMFMDGGNPGIGRFSWRLTPSSGDAYTGSEVMNLYTTGLLDLPSGTIHVGSLGIYSYNGSSRYVRFTSNGSANDLLSAGASLLINYSNEVSPSSASQDVELFGGTATGAPKLTVNGVVSLGGGAFDGVGATYHSLIVNPGPSQGTNPLVDIRAPGGLTPIYVDGVGNIGIGTTSPVVPLEVNVQSIFGSGVTVVGLLEANLGVNASSDISTTAGIYSTTEMGVGFTRYAYYRDYGTEYIGSGGIYTATINVEDPIDFTTYTYTDEGDFETNTDGKGFIVTSPDGTIRKRIGIDNSGNITLTTP